MRWRLDILKKHGLGIRRSRRPSPGSTRSPGPRSFWTPCGKDNQVIILSDTFEQFAKPLMEKLELAHHLLQYLEVATSGEITGFRMRCPQSKLTTCGPSVHAAMTPSPRRGQLQRPGMIQASKAGFLFKSTDAIKADHPEVPPMRSSATCSRPSVRRLDDCGRAHIWRNKPNVL